VTTEILRSATSRARLASLAEVQFGDVVKAVVDVRRRVMAIGGELHSDEEAALIEDRSGQEDLWGRMKNSGTSFARSSPRSWKVDRPG